MRYAIRSTCTRLLGAIAPIVLMALAAAVAPAPANAQWKPERAVEIVVGSAPGGGNDKSARVIQKIFKDLGLVEVNVVNRVGGGGSVAYTYVSQKTADGSIALAQAGLNTNHIAGRSPLHYTDMTPLAFVGNEPVGLAVRADSPYKTLKDLVAVAYWEQAFAKAVNNPQWKQYLAQNAWDWGYMSSKDTAAYLKQDYDLSKRLLTELGMAKQ